MSSPESLTSPPDVSRNTSGHAGDADQVETSAYVASKWGPHTDQRANPSQHVEHRPDGRQQSPAYLGSFDLPPRAKRIASAVNHTLSAAPPSNGISHQLLALSTLVATRTATTTASTARQAKKTAPCAGGNKRGEFLAI